MPVCAARLAQNLSRNACALATSPPEYPSLLDPARGGFFRTAHERDIADFSPGSRSAAEVTLALVSLNAQAASGSGRRREPASCLTSMIGPHRGRVPGPARPAVACQKSPKLIRSR